MSVPFDSRWAPALGWALLHFLWQGTLVALGLALLTRVLRRSEFRYLAACLSLALCVLLPVWGTARGLEARNIAVPRDFLLPASEDQINPTTSPLPGPRQSLRLRLERAIAPRLPLLVGLWSLGCAIMTLRLGSGWLWTLRWRRRGSPAPTFWSEHLPMLSHRLGLKRRVRLLASHLVDSPMALGLWKPVILVPMGLFSGMKPELLEALLVHELAHIRRHDYLVNLLQSFVEATLFYHPAVWWISRRIRTEREILADDLAAKALGEPRRLALALNTLDDLQPLLTTPALAASGGHLMNRIEHLLQPAKDPRKTSTLAWAAPAFLAMALLTPLAAAITRETRNEVPKIYAPASLVQQIDTLAKKEGIDPALLRAIAQVESHFNPQATSSLGAKGLLQVMPETALKYGATDLNDPDQVAAAGARYLKSLLVRYDNDWSKAVPAYNAGAEGFDAGSLRPETPAYVVEVLKLAKAQAIQPDDLIALPHGLPVIGAKTTNAFGPHQAPTGFHPGIDLKSPLGTPVQATAAGTVTFAGPDGDHGITVVLQHGRGLETSYSHLAEAHVKVGDKIEYGTNLGTVGRTGKATGPHVHYEVRQDGKAVDPSASIQATNPDLAVSGMIRSNAKGDLELSLKIRCAGGLKVEIFPEGETKTVGEITIGSRGEPDLGMTEYFPKMTLKNKYAGKRLRIRCTDHAGEGRWGETLVDTPTKPVAFAFALDHAPGKN